jgi:hypothetical protein
MFFQWVLNLVVIGECFLRSLKFDISIERKRLLNCFLCTLII